METRNEVYLEFAVTRLKEIFRSMLSKGPVLPDLRISNAIISEMNTALFVIAFLNWAISPRSIAYDLMRVLARVGIYVMDQTVDFVVDSLCRRREARDAVLLWAHFWCLNFLFPLMDRQTPKTETDFSHKIRLLRYLATQRDSNRCIVTGVHDIFSASSLEPSGVLTPVHIIPARIQDNQVAKHLIQIFTGGRIPPRRLSPENIDTCDNILMLSTSISTTFEQYRWSIKPELQRNITFSDSTASSRSSNTYNYTLAKVSMHQVQPIHLIPPSHSQLHFSTGPEGHLFKGPDPILFALHFSLAQILDATQAGRIILELQHAEWRFLVQKRGLVEPGYDPAAVVVFVRNLSRDYLKRTLDWAVEPGELVRGRDEEVQRLVAGGVLSM
ncbi:hypothetical protein EMCG_05245 [[Emmonsia] crescens]|uniref:HNH nuclease domain-containing protein n=1 Tax=[Emmonsia] crescens TaxID=73230 RepID=A0A0G2IXS9_9EURO|nr:hypothetical protein EMCG_05245 [Emmonsia crescens UAMH 3008]